MSATDKLLVEHVAREINWLANKKYNLYHVDKGVSMDLARVAIDAVNSYKHPEKINSTGDCWNKAFHYLIRNGGEYVIGSFGEKNYYHVIVEKDGRIWDPGTEINWEPHIFYSLNQWQERARLSKQELADKLIKENGEIRFHISSIGLPVEYDERGCGYMPNYTNQHTDHIVDVNKMVSNQHLQSFIVSTNDPRMNLMTGIPPQKPE